MINVINTTIPATKAKTEFGKLIDMARTEPVSITRNGRSVAVMISPDEYEKLSLIDDTYWGMQAQQAEAKGFVGEKESAEFMSAVLNDAK